MQYRFAVNFGTLSTSLDEDMKRGVLDLYLGHVTLDPDLERTTLIAGASLDPDLRCASLDPDPGDSAGSGPAALEPLDHVSHPSSIENFDIKLSTEPLMHSI